MVNKHINALKSALVISQVNAELKTCSVSKTLVFNSAMTQLITQEDFSSKYYFLLLCCVISVMRSVLYNKFLYTIKEQQNQRDMQRMNRTQLRNICAKNLHHFMMKITLSRASLKVKRRPWYTDTNASLTLHHSALISTSCPILRQDKGSVPVLCQQLGLYSLDAVLQQKLNFDIMAHLYAIFLKLAHKEKIWLLVGPKCIIQQITYLTSMKLIKLNMRHFKF